MPRYRGIGMPKSKKKAVVQLSEASHSAGIVMALRDSGSQTARVTSQVQQLYSGNDT